MIADEPECNISRIEHATSEGYEQTFAQTCADAAVHMARARMSLDSESFNPDQVMTHLDAAIACLQRISRRCPPSLIQAKSSVLAFQPARNRKSA
jgi:hypothetical protein